LQLSKYRTGSFSILTSFSLLSRVGDQQQCSYSFKNTGLVPSLSLTASLSSQGRETSNSLPPAFKIPFWFLLYPSLLLSPLKGGRPATIFLQLSKYRSGSFSIPTSLSLRQERENPFLSNGKSPSPLPFLPPACTGDKVQMISKLIGIYNASKCK
jgi:hypothetical protein